MSWIRFYVYQYIREDGTPFYIGKGSKNRINESHLPWVQIPPEEYRIIIKDDLNEKDAFDLELSLIKKYGRKCDGGILENIKITRWVAQAGWKHSNEAKQKISEKNFGKIRTKEQREKYKKPKSASHRENIRLANIGRLPDIERNNKIKETMKNKKWYNNGVNSVFCNPENKPENYVPGRIMRGKLNVMA
jgi:inorganic triphosphatase YgiF